MCSAAPPKQPRFVWINKDATSSNLGNSRDSRDLLYAIHSHVVRTSSGTKRKSFSTKSAQAVKRRSATRRPREDGTRPGASRVDEYCQSDDREIEEIVSAESAESPTHQHLWDETATVHQRHALTAATLFDVVDPFNCNACSLDKNTYSVMQYHLDYSRYYLFRNEAQMQRWNQLWTQQSHPYSRFVRKLFVNSLQHPMHFHSLAAATATRMLTLFPENGSIRSVAQSSMQCAVREMRSYLVELKCEETITIEAVTDIVLLCMAAWFRGDLETAQVHLKPLRGMHKRRCEVDLILVKLLRTIDTYIAAEAGTRPVLPCVWNPQPPPRDKFAQMSSQMQAVDVPRTRSVFDFDIILTPEECLQSPVGPYEHLRRKLTDEEARLLGPGLTGIEQKSSVGFAEAILEDVFDEHLTEVLRTYLPYSAINTHIWIDGQPDESNIQWTDEALKLVIYQLLEKNERVLSDSMDVRTWLSECARLGLLIFTIFGPNPMAKRATQRIVPRMKAAVEGYERACERRAQQHAPTSTVIESQVLLYSLVLGVFSSHEQLKESEWFIDRAANVAKSLGIRSYLKLHRIMGKFGHCDTLHLAAISMVVERINQTRNEDRKWLDEEMQSYMA
jgi:hypothetical protein